MGKVIVLLVLHLVLMVMTIVNAVIANNNVSRVLWIISATCWTLLFIGDVVKLVLM